MNVDVDANDAAYPATPRKSNGVSSWFQLYQSPSTGWVYASWSLAGSRINNGPDGFVFGVQIDSDDANGHHRSVLELEVQGGDCVPVGLAPLPGIQSFDYLLEAGAWGGSIQAQCSMTISWELEVGVKFSIMDLGTHAEFRLGESGTCSDGAQWDSEVLLQRRGKGALLCPNCIS